MSYSYQDGTYIINVNVTNHLAWSWAPVQPFAGDFAVSFDIQQILENHGICGVAFGEDGDNFALIKVSATGYYTVERAVDGQWLPSVVPWTAVESGLDDPASFALRLTKRGDAAWLSIDGRSAGSFACPNYTTHQLAVAVQTFDSAPIRVALDNFTLTPPPANQPPVASFSHSPECPGVGETVTFDASASTDSDGTIVSYAWSFGDGTSDTGTTALHSFAAPLTFLVTLSVADSDGATDSVSQLIHVVTTNLPPTAAFEFTPASPQPGGWNRFDATGSNDVDGTIVSYAWTFGDGSNDTGAIVFHSFAGAGAFNVTLIVADEDGATDSVSQAIQVGPADLGSTSDWRYPTLEQAIAAAEWGDRQAQEDGNVLGPWRVYLPDAPALCRPSVFVDTPLFEFAWAAYFSREYRGVAIERADITTELLQAEQGELACSVVLLGTRMQFHLDYKAVIRQGTQLLQSYDVYYVDMDEDDRCSDNYWGTVYFQFEVELLDANLPFTLVVTGPDETLEFPIDVSKLGPGEFH